jgi:hypothetical protein
MEQREVSSLFVVSGLVGITFFVTPCVSLLFVVLCNPLQHLTQPVALSARAVSAIAVRYWIVWLYQVAHKVSLPKTAEVPPNPAVHRSRASTAR